MGAVFLTFDVTEIGYWISFVKIVAADIKLMCAFLEFKAGAFKLPDDNFFDYISSMCESLVSNLSNLGSLGLPSHLWDGKLVAFSKEGEKTPEVVGSSPNLDENCSTFIFFRCSRGFG